MFDLAKEPMAIAGEFQSHMFWNGAQYEKWVIGIVDDPAVLNGKNGKTLIAECINAKGAISVVEFLISSKQLRSEELQESNEGKFVYIRKVD